MNNILGYFIAIIIGFIMGIMGAGGAIITIPVLVYLFKIEPVLATSYSLFIVGVNSFFGVLSYNNKKLVQFKTGLLFFIPSIIGISLSRRLILPNIPKEIFYLGHFLITKSNLLLLFFSIIMIISAYSMIKKEDTKITNSEKNYLADIF
ncbi:MAG: sulfite exporter TauE/SafE family protein, partial [Cyanobacteriota bacterium]